MRPEKLLFFVEKLLDSNFGKQNSHIIDPKLSFKVYSKLNHCFKNISRKYYRNNLKNFDLLNSDHLCICLYLFSKELFKIKKYELAKKFFLLNKMINGIDLFYKVNMPRIFMFCHPQSSVIGNGKFSDYCIFFQNVTIGRKGKNYPKWIYGWFKVSQSNIGFVHFCRFEDLVSDPKSEFIKMINFYNIELDDKKIDQIVKETEGKKDMETNVNEALILPWAHSSNFRSGKIGSWKDEFSLSNIDNFKKIAGSDLIKLNYEKDLNW